MRSESTAIPPLRALTPSKALRSLLGCALLLAACGGRPEGVRPSTIAPAEEDLAQDPAPADVDPPTGQLPETVTPTRYVLAMTVDPSEERFSGEVTIAVTTTTPTQQIWMHGNELQVASARVTSADGAEITGAWSQVDENGLAELRLDQTLAPGDSTLTIRYTAPFNRALRGLYRVDEDGAAYAFTQFEAISARLAFPCFDEPRFKTPFEVTLTVRRGDVAAFNTPEVDRQDVEDMTRVRFAPTQPLPTYLLALAVGPLDVVEHAPLPPNGIRTTPLAFRGLAARGKGAELAFAMEHTGALVEALERYFGMPYPYEKLDIVAVPDFAAGAMENAGLITFRETLLLLGDDAPIGQQRAYAYVMAHELAHQWFGNLVTLQWWDDLWLNEAFATWMGYKIQDEVFPEHNGNLSMLSRVHSAMGTDSLVSARQIRQPIETSHDIRNAFDSITYRKGGGTLAMFERYLGAEVFQTGVRAYMREHAHGTATYEDLLSALGTASGQDVQAPFSTFLFQAGLPFVQVAVSCDGDTPQVGLTQSRYLPVGSTGSTEQTWQLPVCVRYGVGSETKTACTLMTETQATLPLEGCPDWLMPNADGVGYYRFAMAADDLAKLRERGYSNLTPAEQMAYADGLQAAFGNATISVEDLLAATAPLVRSPIRSVATMPMELHAFLRDRVVPEANRAKVTRASARLYAPIARRLGWNVRRGEDAETTLLRAHVIDHMALFVEDAGTRREAVRRAERYLGMGRRGDGEIHADAVDANLVPVVLAVAVQERDVAFFDALIERFAATPDSLLRGRILYALSKTHDEALAERARALALDERLRTNEVMTPLYVQGNMPETREATWAWVVANFDALSSLLETGSSRLISAGHAFCSTEGAAQVEAFFTPRIESIPGGPRTLATMLEGIRLCGARADAHRESALRAFR